jgi:hypothetical protein
MFGLIGYLDQMQSNYGVVKAADGRSKFEWDTERILEKIESDRQDGRTGFFNKVVGGTGGIFSLREDISPFDKAHPFQSGLGTGGSDEEAFTRSMLPGAAAYYRAIAASSTEVREAIDGAYHLEGDQLKLGGDAEARRRLHGKDIDVAGIESAYGVRVPAKKKAKGYAEGGGVGSAMFTSQGTDTVPAMLTPGEYVIKKSSVDALGIDFLDYLNNSSQKSTRGRYNRGGQVQYLQEGGEKTSVGSMKLDTTAFDASVKQFSTIVDTLKGIKLGGTLTVDGTVNVNVNLNGHEVLAEAKKELGQAAGDKIDGGIIQMLKAHFPKIHPKLSYTPAGPSHPGPP